MQCRVCGNSLDTRAVTCPHCGTALHGPKRFRVFLTVVLIAVLIGLLVLKKQDLQRAEQTATADRQRLANLLQDLDREAHSGDPDDVSRVVATRRKKLVLQTVQLKQSINDLASFHLTSAIATANGAGCFGFVARTVAGALVPGTAVITPDGRVFRDFTDGQEGQRARQAWEEYCIQPGGEDWVEFLVQSGVADRQP